MSKIGRKSIDINSAKVEIKGQEVHYSGPKGSGVHILPAELSASLDGSELTLVPVKTAKNPRDINRVWGLHRALLANEITGVTTGFEKQIQIIGLGYKAALTGNKVVFSLGYSHKIDYELPKGVTLEVDKTGQNLIFRSYDKALVGHVCSLVRAMRPPEPYKGTGVKLANEVIRRKAGKTKAA
jgi:large subunit ribosomal protein L6